MRKLPRFGAVVLALAAAMSGAGGSVARACGPCDDAANALVSAQNQVANVAAAIAQAQGPRDAAVWAMGEALLALDNAWVQLNSDTWVMATTDEYDRELDPSDPDYESKHNANIAVYNAAAINAGYDSIAVYYAAKAVDDAQAAATYTNDQFNDWWISTGAPSQQIAADNVTSAAADLAALDCI